MPRRVVLPLVLLVMTASACARREPPQQPAAPAESPPVVPLNGADRERARLDSIARAEEAARLARAAEERDLRVRAIVQEMVFFDFDESALRRDAQETLARKVAVLRANPGLAIRVDGHADERGSVEYNLALGFRRAGAVQDYLTGFGIDASRIEITSFGEDRPLDARSTEDAWARNRRAEFQILRGGSNLLEPGW